MQDLDPSRRPGAGPGGYTALKMHPFFRGVEWTNLRQKIPPKLALEVALCHHCHLNCSWEKGLLSFVFEHTDVNALLLSLYFRLTQVKAMKVMILHGTLPTLEMVDQDKMRGILVPRHPLKQLRI